jgi:hypothetical protein
LCTKFDIYVILLSGDRYLYWWIITEVSIPWGVNNPPVEVSIPWGPSNPPVEASIPWEANNLPVEVSIPWFIPETLLVH